MFDELLNVARSLGETGSPSESPKEIAKYLPSKYTARDVVDGIIGPHTSGSIGSLLAIQACLESENLLVEEDSDSGPFVEIAEYVARSILPAASTSEDARPEWGKIKSRGTVGLEILEDLDDKFRVDRDSPVLLATTAYTNTKDPWTTEESSSKAHNILKRQLERKEAKRKLILDTILSSFLRPLFSKSRPATVTASGRKAEFIEPSRYNAPALDAEATKPWKHQQKYAITIFEWAILNADEELLAQHWHMFTPVMLTLLDESQTDIKIRALNIFSSFWTQCPSGLMEKVGLAEVFEQAVFPAVLYLPSLTPEEEAIGILDAAYPALFQIAGLPYPETLIGEPVSYPEFTGAQKKLLDKIIREGILVGYHHASEHIRLAELFCGKARSAVNGMGILAAKHLKDLIPLISGITTDPFGTKHPPTFLAATRLLQSIMRCCWPRIPIYCNEIVRIITISYLNVEDEDAFPAGSPTQDDLRAELTKTAAILAAVMRSQDINLFELVLPLVEKEPLLGDLFTNTKKHLTP